MLQQPYHIPALLEEAIKLLNINPSGVYIDATFGGGGHSRAIIEALGPSGKLYGFDRDLDALANEIHDSRFTFVHSNYRYIENFMRFYREHKADGILADLGVSFHHFDTPERGFSFRADGPLDMRMNTAADRTAADIVATYSVEKLTSMLKLYTDLKRPRIVADAIVKSRSLSPVDTTFKLAEAVKNVVNPRQEKKDLAQIFQALRIETNNEAADLIAFLNATLRVLKPGGRLAVLTYHSGEDRVVKNFLRTGNVAGEEQKDIFGNISTPWKLITRKPVEASEEEIAANPRARSAKLRVAELKHLSPDD